MDASVERASRGSFGCINGGGVLQSEMLWVMVGDRGALEGPGPRTVST